MLVVMNVLVVLPLVDSHTVDGCEIILLVVSLVVAKIVLIRFVTKLFDPDMEIFLVNDKQIEPQLLYRDGTPPPPSKLMLSEEFPGYRNRH